MYILTEEDFALPVKFTEGNFAIGRDFVLFAKKCMGDLFAYEKWWKMMKNEEGFFPGCILSVSHEILILEKKEFTVYSMYMIFNTMTKLIMTTYRMNKILCPRSDGLLEIYKNIYLIHQETQAVDIFFLEWKKNKKKKTDI